MYKKYVLMFVFISTILFTSAAVSFAQDTGVYLRTGLGAGRPLMESLSNELEKQGNQMPELEYVLPVSVGRIFFDGSIGAELMFSYSLTNVIRYKNAHEDFEEKMGHYDFSFLLRKYLLPGNKKFSPSIGVGIGYGRSNLVAGGGRLESAEMLASALIESRFKERTGFFIEAIYIRGLSEERFDAVHLENVSQDVVLDSRGIPLEDVYSVFEIRVGFTFWLKTPKEYY